MQLLNRYHLSSSLFIVLMDMIAFVSYPRTLVWVLGIYMMKKDSLRQSQCCHWLLCAKIHQESVFELYGADSGVCHCPIVGLCLPVLLQVSCIMWMTLESSTMLIFTISFIHSDYFYSASSSPLLFGGAPDTTRILCWSFTLKHHRQLRVKDLLKVPVWRPEQDSNPWPFRRRVTNLPLGGAKGGRKW